MARELTMYAWCNLLKLELEGPYPSYRAAMDREPEGSFADEWQLVSFIFRVGGK